MARDRKVEINENLTVDGAQGQEANIIIYMLVKPTEDAQRLGFVSDRRRMNIALSRAKEVLVIIGNLTVWDEQQRVKMKKFRVAKSILGLLEDVINRKHVFN
jgi:superfamily I DNA and/or RNA helicase